MTILQLVSLGNVVVDIVTRIDELPERGSDVLASSASIEVGGSGFNALVAATRQGLPSIYGGAHGTGSFGDLARSALAREGIRVALGPVLDADTGFDVAMVDGDGERTFVTAAGAEAQLTSEHLLQLSLEIGDAVHVSGYALAHPAVRSAIIGRLIGFEGTVVFDPGPLGHRTPSAELDWLLERADWWTGNRHEARLATGLDDPWAAARSIAGRNRAGVVVRLGPEGCLVAEVGGDPIHVHGYAVDVVDTTGAGDAHVGAFIAALAVGANPMAAAQRANAVAAITTSRWGPASSPDRDEIDAFLVERNQRSKAR